MTDPVLRMIRSNKNELTHGEAVVLSSTVEKYMLHIQ